MHIGQSPPPADVTDPPGVRLRRTVSDAAIVAAVVLLACTLGILTRPTGLLASFWPANAILLGLMVRRPNLAGPTGWCAAAAAFVVTDILAGSTPERAILLSAANLAGIAVAYRLFSRLDEEDRVLRRPTSIVLFLACTAAGSAAAGMIGAVANPVLFGGTTVDGFIFWFTTELANYIAVLPVMLTAPALAPGLARRLPAALRRSPARQFAPLAAFAASMAIGMTWQMPASIPLPIPALLWCAVSYSLFSTSLLTLVFSIWVLLVFTIDPLSGAMSEQLQHDLVLQRLGVMLFAIAPIMVASVMCARQTLLRRAATARAEAEEALASRSLLLATMTHELRTPINAVMGYADLIVRRPGEARSGEYGRAIHEAGGHLLGLVNDLLDTAKVEAGAVSLEFETFRSRPLVEQAMRLVQGMAYDRKVRLRLEDGSWPAAVCDARAVKQILLNLLSNALKVAPAGTDVTVTGGIEGNRLVIAVSDHGPGITEDDVSRLGRAYVQAGDAALQKQGTGLGLALSIRLIEQHGGQLRFGPAPGGGTTVRFDLALAERRGTSIPCEGDLL